MKLFAVDIGNTSISCGLFYNNKIINRALFNKNDVSSLLSFIREEREEEEVVVVISSVDPNQTLQLKNQLKATKFKSYIINHNNCGLLMDVDSANEVGVDRICNSYAAIELYKLPCLVIDFGTATTYDVVNKNKTFIGGSIAPGIEVSSENLISRAALLDKVTYEIPKYAIGKNTHTNLQSGIVLGAVDSVNGMVQRIKNEIEKDDELIIVLTGGFSHIISPVIDFKHDINLELTLVGINLIYLNEIQSK